MTWLGLGLAGVLLLSVAYCAGHQPARDAARKAEAAATLADGRTRAVQDASTIRDAHEARTDQTRQDVKEAQDAVRQETDPARRDAVARQRLCNLNPGACPR
ncbi:MAG: hypothetical protein HZY74_01145 [Brevundimonas sp.]|nr:MAG: hypothetical protein HZY74_01145 [Brevundimonas sp.]